MGCARAAGSCDRAPARCARTLGPVVFLSQALRGTSAKCSLTCPGTAATIRPFRPRSAARVRLSHSGGRVREITARALDTARVRGAQYADVRVVETREQFV